MAALTSIMIMFFLLSFSVSTVSSQGNNITQFENFTVDWEDFNLLTCAVPISINISLFTCLPLAEYTQVDDTSCLAETAINFDEYTCQPTTNGIMYTSMISTATQQMITAGTMQIQTTKSATATAQPITAGITSQASITTGTSSTSTTSSSNVSSTSTTSSSNASSTSTTRSSNVSSTSTTSSSNVSSTSTTSSSNASSTSTTRSSNVSSTSTTSSSNVSSASTTSSSNVSSTSTASSGNVSSTSTARSSNVSSTSTASSSNASSTSTPAPNLYICQTDEYIGIYCNMSSDACAMSQPCLNEATCIPNRTLEYGYYCLCQTGYTGHDCQYDERACMENTCWHNGTCIPINMTVASNNQSDFKCECVRGYDGVYCELEIDLCDNVTCENNGVCLTTQFMWKCICLDSSLYYGEYCQFKTKALKIREILSKSFASIAIGMIIATCVFIIVMDVLKYGFHIDPVEVERESYRKRREARRRARRGIRSTEPKLALRFKYIS